MERECSDVADFGSVPQGLYGVLPGGNEFLSHKPRIACIDDRLHDRWIVDLLQVIEFPATGISGCVVVADQVMVLLNAANDITVHDLHMVDVEEQPEVWGVHSADQVKTSFHIISKVSWVSLHGMGIIFRVEVFEAECDSVLCGVVDDAIPEIKAVSFCGGI